MGRVPQKPRALCAIIFSRYPALFDDPVWKDQYNFMGFDATHIRYVNDAALPKVREFLKHLKYLSLDSAIDTVNAEGDSFVDGRDAYFTWWSRFELLSKLKLVHEAAIRRSGINIKAMYRNNKATRGNLKFVTSAMFRDKEAELAEALFGTAHKDNESGATRLEFQELLQCLTQEYIERNRKSFKNANSAKEGAKNHLDFVWKALEQGYGTISLKDAKKISLALVRYEKCIGWEATDEDRMEVAMIEKRKGEFNQALTDSKVNKEELKSHRIRQDGNVGPFVSQDEFHAQQICTPWEPLDDRIQGALMKRQSTQYRICFTHGDITPNNILVDERLRPTGLIVWECTVWMPRYWDYTRSIWIRQSYSGWRNLFGEDEVAVKMAV
ncbi:hypothetical protein EDD85DRAFT_938686 [Armillaria nabsnona]|nr:hypothetical protein EDD85DRAFT_938686 [Armillaria nabsnona]